MKTFKTLLFVLLLGFGLNVMAQVAVNTDGSDPDVSAMLDIKSTTKGVLLPRMTEAERDLILNPVAGLLIYQTDNIAGYYYFDGTIWEVIGTGAFAINNLYDGKTGGNSVFLGSGAGINDDGTNNRNVAIGTDALRENISGYDNVAIGRAAMRYNTTGYYNTAIGYWSLFYNTTGYNNTANGYLSLMKNTTGRSNTALGYSTLRTNTTGGSNTAVGTAALYFNTTGDENTAIGSGALYFNQTGNFNTANGRSALQNNKGGKNNAFGNSALFNNTSGNNNIAVGFYSSSKNTTGNNNISIGNWANSNNQEGSNNTIIGYEAGQGTANHNKSGNVFLGYQAGYNEMGNNKLYIENSNSLSPLIYGEFDSDLLRINGTLDINNAYQLPTVDGTSGQIMHTDGNGSLSWDNDLGATALQWTDTINQLATDYNVSLKQNISDTLTVDATRHWVNQQSFLTTVEINTLIDGKTGGNSVFLGSGAGINDDGTNNWNVAIGKDAMRYNTTGDENTAIGYGSLLQNTTGVNNTANGYLSLSANTTGFSNTALGHGALRLNSTGYFNTAVGVSALYFNTTGNSNTATGGGVLSNNQTGNYNTANGNSALQKNTSGNNNVAMGYNSLYNNTTGNYNISIGDWANYYNQEGSNNTIIGYEAGKGTANHNKSGNVFLGYQAGYNETGNNKLYIENSNSLSPLIYGEFDNHLFRINGTLDINNAYQLPTVDGTSGQIMHTDGNGDLSWDNDLGATALQWTDTTNQLATDYNVSLKQNISDTLTVDATRHWVNQQSFLSTVEINTLIDGKTGGKSVFLGSGAGINDDGTDHWNVAIGIDALHTNTLGTYNTAIGFESLYSNTTASNNTATGYKSLYYTTTGMGNTANGHYTLLHNTTGAYNTAIGNSALFSNTTGHANTAVGNWALDKNKTGTHNTANGHSALMQNISGCANVANGFWALESNTTGYSNVGIGYGSNYYNQEGSNNTIIGYEAGKGTANHNKSGNVFLGYQAGYNETGNNKLYIENSNSLSPLIYGEFDNNFITIYGNLGLGSTTFGNGTKTFAIINGVVPTVSISDGVLLYSEDESTSSELRVRDEAGNITTLSPHNFSMIKKSEPMAWSYYSENTVTGKKVNIDMLNVIRLVESLTGDKLVFIENIEGNPKSNQIKEKRTGIVQQQQYEIEELKKLINKQQINITLLLNQNVELSNRIEKLENNN